MTVDMILLLSILFVIKHFLADFLFQQNPYLWSNKHIYGHWGGISHVGIHGIFTLIVFLIVFNKHFFQLFDIIYITTLLEMFIHYHIDWAKMNINISKNWKCDKHSEFWLLTGFDQMLHYLTYVLMMYIIYINL